MNFVENFPNRIKEFITLSNQNHVKMILVGGGAVNFHGYQRHSADIDFWIDISAENLINLLQTIVEMGYNVNSLPEEVKKGQQNISIKISPVFDLELITNFNPGKTFNEAFKDSVLIEKDDLSYFVLSFSDLIKSKITSDRPKDKLDVEELHRIQLEKKKRH